MSARAPPSSPAPYLLVPVDLDADAVALFATLLSAFGRSATLLNLLSPVSLYPSHEAALIRSGADGFLSEKSDPNMHWMKITDPATGSLAAAIQLKLYASDPYATAVASSAPISTAPRSGNRDFWPPNLGADETLRALRDAVVREYVAPRKAMRRRPHAWIHTLFAGAEHQGQGMGSALLAWAVGRIDEAGLEAHVEATRGARPLYERFGFVHVATNYLDPKGKGRPDLEGWDGLCDRLGFPEVVCLMWRPPGGAEYDPERTPVPWKGGVVEPERHWTGLFE